MSQGLLSTADWLIVAIYFLAVFAIAAWSARKEKTRQTSEGYFLAGRNVGWFVIGASLFASNIGSEHLVGLAGTGAANGVAVAQFEVQASLVLLLLGWVFVPFYIRSGVFTMPEFLERRYSPAARWYLALVSIAGYVLTKISVTIAAGGIVFESLMGIDFWTGAIIVVVATGVYTILGGLRAVLYTDMLQMFVLVAGGVVVTVIGLNKLGGWGEMERLAGDGFLTMWKPMNDPDFPWTGILFAAPLLGVWYWCTDQFIVQRVLSAANIAQARQGALMAAYLKQLPLFIFVIPGVVAYGLVQKGLLTLDRPDQALPALMGTLLPVGFKGLCTAGLLAALMSSLSSVFNSCSTLITLDIYKKLHPGVSDRRLVLVGQVSTVALVGLGLAWIPLMDNISEQLYKYLQSVQAYIAPPIAVVFLMGIFWARVNSAGAMTALIAGFFLGAARLIAELNKASLGDGWLYTFADINFLHFALFLLIVCSALMVAVSLATAPPPRDQLRGLTFATPDTSPASDAHQADPHRARSLLFTLILLALIAAVWAYFS